MEKDDWIPLEAPDNFEDILETMFESTEERVGWCLLCNQAIKTEADLIPDTSTHNCPEGRALEDMIQKP